MLDLVIRNTWILEVDGANGLLPEATRAGKLLREFGTV